MRSSLERSLRSSHCGPFVGAVDGQKQRRRCRKPRYARGQDPTEVQEHGARAWGHPETWEALSFSPNTRDGQPADQVLALRRARDAANEPTCQR